MCLYPKLIKNRKYLPNKKNGWQAPPVLDERTIYVPIGCQECMECRKQKSREWLVRLSEDIKKHTNGNFVTLTLSNDTYKKYHEIVQQEINSLNIRMELEVDEKQTKSRLQKITGYGLDNEIAKIAVRRFLERYRKENKKSLRHWLVTELGHYGTENIHLHGIIYTDNHKDIQKHWGKDFVWTGYDEDGKRINWVNQQTINYCVKYIYKQDPEHPSFKAKILTSPGIGNNYINKINFKLNKYNGTETNETYKTNNGYKIGLPIYYRNHRYTEEEKEKLWINKLDKQERWVDKIKIDISKTDREYYKALAYARTKNRELGYGTGKHEWNAKRYEMEQRKIMQETRIRNASGSAFGGKFSKGMD